MEHTYHHGYETVFKKCKETLKDLDMEIESHNKEKGVIQASTGSSLLSWGENIQIEIKKVGTTKTKVVVESEASAQLFSWGKNNKNASSIINELSNKLRA